MVIERNLEIEDVELCSDCGREVADTECLRCETPLCSGCQGNQDGLCSSCFQD